MSGARVSSMVRYPGAGGEEYSSGVLRSGGIATSLREPREQSFEPCHAFAKIAYIPAQFPDLPVEEQEPSDKDGGGYPDFD